MNKETLNACKELAQLIAKDERIIALDAAKKLYEEDAELKKLMTEYNVQQLALTEEYKKDVHDEEFINIINKRIEELYNMISNSPVMIKYMEAQEEVNAFMNEVNSEITFFLTGERACTHDCSSCHSGCASKR